MTQQKTWIDLLGEDDSNCLVDGRCVVRKAGNGFIILWWGDDEAQAHRVLSHWRKEIQAKLLQSVVYKAQEWKEGERGPSDLALKLIPLEYRFDHEGYHHSIFKLSVDEPWSVHRWAFDRTQIPPYMQILSNDFEWVGVIEFNMKQRAKFATAEQVVEYLTSTYTCCNGECTPVSSNG